MLLSAFIMNSQKHRPLIRILVIENDSRHFP